MSLSRVILEGPAVFNDDNENAFHFFILSIRLPAQNNK